MPGDQAGGVGFPKWCPFEPRSRYPLNYKAFFEALMDESEPYRVESIAVGAKIRMILAQR